MKKLAVTLLAFIPLIALSSCANSSNPRILKNGALLSQSEITYENAFRDVNASDMKELLKSNETFVFYLTSSECHACYEFQDKILSYIQNTKNLVYRMDLYDNREEFEKFATEYHDYFFYDNQIATPQIFIAQGENVATKVPYSRYSTASMFKRAMKDYINESNVYSFKSASNYKQYIDSKDEYMTLVIDRNNSSVMDLYNSEISDIIKKSKKDVAVFELSEDNTFGLNNISYPIGFYHSSTEDVQYIFTPDSPENKTFLEKYC